MIGFIGLSHLGLNYSLATAAKGFEVNAYDPDEALSARCQAGDFPIQEPGYTELFTKHRVRLRYTSDSSWLSKCDLVFYSLDVRTDDRNQSDLTLLNKLIHDTVPFLSAGTTVVVLSQVPPGYTRKLAADLTKHPEVKAKSFFYQVETLVFGAAVQRAMEPERFIVGAPEANYSLPRNYRNWHAAFGCPVFVMRFESAELAKIAINFFLVSSVTTTNVLAEVCEAIGADWFEIVPTLRLDKRIGQHAYLNPGLGIAGGNLERDLVTILGLSYPHGIDDGVIRAWQENSSHRRLWALQRLQRELLDQVPDPLIAVWGLTYKPDTHSTKNSPALDLLRGLRGRRVRVHDPVAAIDASEFGWVTRCPTPLEAVDGADALVIMSAWRIYSNISAPDLRGKLAGQLVLDPYGALDEEACRSVGLVYHKLGC